MVHLTSEATSASVSQAAAGSDAAKVSVPVRLQLSRGKGFDLQGGSQLRNGLSAVNVARPSRWGNPFNFRSSDNCWNALALGCRGDAKGRHEASVKAFRNWVDDPRGRVKEWDFGVVMEIKGKSLRLGSRAHADVAPSHAEIRQALRGKNLACWCRADQPCHADVLLEIAIKD
jgi:hypothetical protein